MNKRCTNSSCRRTFSTLNADGKCPHCGKLYPQMNCGRRGMREVRFTLREENGKGRRYLNISLDGMLRLGRSGERVKMIRMFREQVNGKGYFVNLRAARDFCVDLIEGKRCATEWYLTDFVNEGLRGIDMRRE